MRGRKRKLPDSFVPEKWATSSSESEYEVPIGVHYHKRRFSARTEESDVSGGKYKIYMLLIYKNINKIKLLKITMIFSRT